MTSDTRKLIAVIGATGQQGGSVLRALQASSEFRVRALTRNPSNHQNLADEVVAADLNRPDTLAAALEGAYGVFAVTNPWEPGNADEITQASALLGAAKAAGVEHFIWSTLPNVESISNGKYDVPHFTNKAKVDVLVSEAGFRYHSFVVAPFFYQNLLGTLAPQMRPDGSTGWTLPIDPAARTVHMGDITELGGIVAGAFAHPARTGDGAYMNLIGYLVSFDDVVETLNRQGHRYTFQQVPADVFAGFFPGAAELAEMFGYFEEHTYMGATAHNRTTLANSVSGNRPTNLATWAWAKMPVSKKAETAKDDGAPLDADAVSRRAILAGTVAAAIGMEVPNG